MARQKAPDPVRIEIKDHLLILGELSRQGLLGKPTPDGIAPEIFKPNETGDNDGNSTEESGKFTGL